MKVFRIIGRNIRDAFKSVSRNFSLSIASIICITITLILVAVTMIVSFNVNKFTKNLENELTIVVFMEQTATDDDSDILESKIKSLSYIDNIEFKSKEDIKSEMQKESQVYDSIMSTWTKENNPLQNVFMVKVTDINQLKNTAESIKEFSKVDAVKYGEKTVDQMVSVFNVVEKATIVIVVALVLVTAFLISNTIKLTIFSRRHEIEIMRLVGTRNLVIRLPYLFEGLFLGIIGSIIPIIVAIYGYILAYDKLDGYVFSNLIRLENPTPFVFYIAGILLLIGGIVGMFGSYRAVRKYLKI